MTLERRVTRKYQFLKWTNQPTIYKEHKINRAKNIFWKKWDFLACLSFSFASQPRIRFIIWIGFITSAWTVRFFVIIDILTPYFVFRTCRQRKLWFRKCLQGMRRNDLHLYCSRWRIFSCSDQFTDRFTFNGETSKSFSYVNVILCYSATFPKKYRLFLQTSFLIKLEYKILMRDLIKNNDSETFHYQIKKSI